MTQQEIQNYLTSVGYAEDMELRWTLPDTNYYLIVNGEWEQVEFFNPNYSSVMTFSIATDTEVLQHWINSSIYDSINPPTY